jgi:hypothetical protein
MKAALSLLVLIATINLARASAGPPPFTNGSPLQSGTDGTYQAVAEGVNLTGVFSFVIKGGLQTSDQSTTINGWVFFVDGNIFTGSVLAAIAEDDVVGILNGEVASQAVPTGTNGIVTLPTAFIIQGNVASGQFSGSISLNNPLAVFEGTGTLEGTGGRVDQLVFISEPTQTVIATGTTIPGNTNTVTITPITIPASAFPLTRFRFEGTRVSTTPATPPAAPAAAASPSPSA